jgi:predicted metal-dependent phosphoesterase TrpH
MRLLIDLHLHTMASHDSYVTLDDAARRCWELGLDGFAVTDHDVLAEIPPSFQEDSGLVIVPGIEISADGGHVTAFDIDEPVEMKLSVRETVERIHDQGGIAIISHPYSVFRTWVNVREVEGAGFDCVEVANAYQFPYHWMVKRTRVLAERLGLPETGGSDAHIPSTVGRAYTVIESEERSLEAVLEAIRRGETKGEGTGISMAERLKWTVSMK